jgi:hypothetical protein
MHTLIPYTQTPFTKALKLSVSVKTSEQGIHLHYLLEGNVAEVLIPKKTRDARRLEGLYHHTCFETFLANRQGKYTEWNFSPSGDWCVYYFEKYRVSDEKCEDRASSFSGLEINEKKDQLELKVTIEQKDLYKFGLSAVVESSQGEFSYWALSHPGSKPDFHDQSSFIAAPIPSF